MVFSTCSQAELTGSLVRPGAARACVAFSGFGESSKAFAYRGGGGVRWLWSGQPSLLLLAIPPSVSRTSSQQIEGCAVAFADLTHMVRS